MARFWVILGSEEALKSALIAETAYSDLRAVIRGPKMRLWAEAAQHQTLSKERSQKNQRGSKLRARVHQPRLSSAQVACRSNASREMNGADSEFEASVRAPSR